jgi:ATP-dependent DNA helicase RecG
MQEVDFYKILNTRIEYLKGVGTKKAGILESDAEIAVFGDLLHYFPFRYQDRSKFQLIKNISENDDYVQVRGRVVSIRTEGEGSKKRLEAVIEDHTGEVKLVWFKSVNWFKNVLKLGNQYIVYGKPQLFGRTFSLSHPEIEPVSDEKKPLHFVPVYETTDKMKRIGLDSRGIGELQKNLLRIIFPYIKENLSASVIEKFKFIDRKTALVAAHYPTNNQILEEAKRRLKFEELFFLQLQLLQKRNFRTEKSNGLIFSLTPSLHRFYNHILPFELTDAQKRVIKEIYTDLKSGKQMNRLVQGDVGSGKTIVAFICALLAFDNSAQTCLMAPTEILAEQHFNNLKPFADQLNIKIGRLMGSSKKKERESIHTDLLSGEMKIIVGTHALLEDVVRFQNLGLCIIDEQHRFGVAQRAKLWAKNPRVSPHVLVMTATPIPRTLAMTLYGDLDVSVIDQMPAGRKPILTRLCFEKDRLRVFGLISEEIKKGRQAYIVYPLIEESEKIDFDYKNLTEGYESIKRAFPDCHISIVHGRMKAADKEFEMQRFVKMETQIMVATTVIEVGVNVPNATLMLIESAERFGLAQLHQLRGRVGRGEHQSHCILMANYQLSSDSRERLQAMVRTTNGFEIADIDLQLRGPGDITGTQQSGTINLKIANLASDAQILTAARDTASDILQQDRWLEKGENVILGEYLKKIREKDPVNWSLIS